jgi:hypothetical protein
MRIRLIPGTYNPERFSIDAPFHQSKEVFPFKVLTDEHRFNISGPDFKRIIEQIPPKVIEFWLSFGSKYLKPTCIQDLYQPYVKIDPLKEEVQILTSQGMFDGDKRPVFYFKF